MTNWLATFLICFKWTAAPEPDVAGYKLYQGTQSGVYTQSVYIPGRLTSNGCIVCPRGVTFTNYFSITAINSNNLESGFAPSLSMNRPPLKLTMDISHVQGRTNAIVAIESSVDLVMWERMFIFGIPPRTNDATYFRGVIE